MKLKLLTLLVTMGLFVFGANAAKEENLTKEQMQQASKLEAKDVFDQLFSVACSTLTTVISKGTVDKACQTACASSPKNPDFKDFVACATSLAKNTKDPDVQKAVTLIKKGCDQGPLCSGKFLGLGGSCQNEIVRKLCGSICCPLGGDVKNCLTSYNDSCAAYK